MSRREIAIIAGLLALLVGALVWAGSHLLERQSQTTSEATGPALIVSEFELVDQDNRTVRDEDLKGKWQLVFFGFTSCPDICATTLTNVSAVLEELGPASTKKLQPFLITVDPERDTPPVLKEYLTSFDPRIRGLTGTPEQVQQTLRSFRVYASQRPLKEGGYTVDHSAFIYLMDPQGAYARHFSAQSPVEELAEQIRATVGA